MGGRATVLETSIALIFSQIQSSRGFQFFPIPNLQMLFWIAGGSFSLNAKSIFWLGSSARTTCTGFQLAPSYRYPLETLNLTQQHRS